MSKLTYVDPKSSESRGFKGIFESFLRRFKIFATLVMITPLYAFGCLLAGAAIAPGVAVFDFLSSFAANRIAPLKYFIFGTSAFAGYLVYGFSILFLTPAINFIFRFKLRPWRGPYYSVEAIRWFLHNAMTYLVRWTFLEFVTPTPFNVLFYRMMGMKIGRGVMINSTWISDPSLIELGDFVTIGGSATLVGHYGQGGYLVLAKTYVGNGVTIGLKATVMGGVTIGDGAKILPNSVLLPKTVVPPGETWGGVPAQKIDIAKERRQVNS